MAGGGGTCMYEGEGDIFICIQQDGRVKISSVAPVGVFNAEGAI